MIYDYVLQSETFNKTYVGQTDNIERRIKEHNAGKTKSTKHYVPWKVLFYESFNSRIDARKREKYLKSGIGRELIRSRIIKQ
jgi:putative endonuclease